MIKVANGIFLVKKAVGPAWLSARMAGGLTSRAKGLRQLGDVHGKPALALRERTSNTFDSLRAKQMNRKEISPEAGQAWSTRNINTPELMAARKNYAAAINNPVR